MLEIQLWGPSHCWNQCPLSPGIVIISHIVIDYLFKYQPGQIYLSSCCKWFEAGRWMEWGESCLKEISPSSNLVKKWVVSGHNSSQAKAWSIFQPFTSDYSHLRAYFQSFIIILTNSTYFQKHWESIICFGFLVSWGLVTGVWGWARSLGPHCGGRVLLGAWQNGMYGIQVEVPGPQTE